MKPKEARQILKCSYTTLANYVKRGLLTCHKDPISRFAEYNDDEIYAIAARKQHADIYEANLKINGKTIFNKELTKEQFEKLKIAMEKINETT